MDYLKLPLVLASGSPRRKEILSTMGLSYIVDVSQVDESAHGSPEQMVVELSGRKAQAVAQKHSDALVLAADTLVYGAGKVLGKPEDPDDAFAMLRALSGEWHEVYTGLTLINTKTGKCIQACECTRVHFVDLSDAEIRAYIETKDPLDKAGAYGIQGQAGMFIDRIDGSYSNVVGLPMAALRRMLIEMLSQDD